MSYKCNVCHNALQASEEDRIYATKCGHVFHYNCLRSWIVTPERGCPNCRSQIRSFTDTMRIYLDMEEENEGRNSASGTNIQMNFDSKFDDLIMVYTNSQDKINDIENMLDKISINITKYDDKVRN